MIILINKSSSKVNKRLIDLHCHTIFSDGSKSPDELIEYAIKNNIKAISITDHNTVDGIKKIMKETYKFDIEIIPGIEITAENDPEVHILGYFIDVYSTKLNNILTIIKKNRFRESMKLLHKVKQINMNFDVKELIEKGSLINGLEIVKYMIEKGYVNDGNEARKLFLDKENPLYVPKKNMSINEAIQVIKEAGGMASLAHPITLSSDMDIVLERIRQMKDLGLDAIECYSSKISLKNQKILLEAANKYNLAITGGSDYHGKIKPEVRIGKVANGEGLDYEILTKLKEYKEVKW